MAYHLKPRSIIVVGPPGSGKGTQASQLAVFLGWPHIDVGELLREAARESNQRAEQIRSLMHRGQMLPQSIVRPIVAEAIIKHQDGFILDGYARQTTQVEILRDWAETGEIAPLLGVELGVPSADLMERIKGRHYCTNCRHKDYLVTTTAAATRCVRCGGHLVQRDDDQAAVVKSRLATYETETRPAIAALRKIAPVLKIDGRGSISEVAARIKEAVRRWHDQA